MGQPTNWLTINDCFTVTRTDQNTPTTLRVFIANNITAINWWDKTRFSLKRLYRLSKRQSLSTTVLFMQDYVHLEDHTQPTYGIIIVIIITIIIITIARKSWHYSCPRSILSVNSILAHCVALWNVPSHNEDFQSHIFHTVGEINTGNARFHSQFHFDLHSFDQNILSFENSLL